jgi:hypothetical protein
MSGGTQALTGAERKGAAARAAGVPRDRNPYPDWRKDDGRLTFSRAFRRAWWKGWDAAGAVDAPAEGRG